MDDWLKQPKNNNKFVLKNVQFPPGLNKTGGPDWLKADLLITDGKIVDIIRCSKKDTTEFEAVDAENGIVMSAFVDCHVHLDKAHVAQWHDFPPCDLSGAKDEMIVNKATWTEAELYARVEFSLRSAFASGVRALRSHVDYSPETLPFVWPVMTAAVERWKSRIDLQLCPLVGIEQFEDQVHAKKAFDAATQTGVLGIFVYDQPGIARRLEPILKKADSLGLDIDFHVDEGLDETLDGLDAVASSVEKTGFSGTVLCGHCVALLTYDQQRRVKTINRAVDAGLHFVTLPITNLYLQGRVPGQPPVNRGMAPVMDMVAAGAHVSLGADNVRDGFCAFGEFDPMMALVLGAQIAHLHEPGRDWPSLITTNPSATLGLEWGGFIEIGAPADLVVFSARNSSELCARLPAEKIVMRQGKWINTNLPAFRQLDEMRQG